MWSNCMWMWPTLWVLNPIAVFQQSSKQKVKSWPGHWQSMTSTTLSDWALQKHRVLSAQMGCQTLRYQGVTSLLSANDSSLASSTDSGCVPLPFLLPTYLLTTSWCTQMKPRPPPTSEQQHSSAYASSLLSTPLLWDVLFDLWVSIYHLGAAGTRVAVFWQHIGWIILVVYMEYLLIYSLFASLHVKCYKIWTIITYLCFSRVLYQTC